MRFTSHSYEKECVVWCLECTKSRQEGGYNKENGMCKCNSRVRLEKTKMQVWMQLKREAGTRKIVCVNAT